MCLPQVPQDKRADAVLQAQGPPMTGDCIAINFAQKGGDYPASSL